MINEFGEDAYWLARVCARQSTNEPKRHYWHAVASEIELRTARKPAAIPDIRRTASNFGAAVDMQFAPRRAATPRRDAYRADAPAGLRDEHSQSHGRYQGAPPTAILKALDRYVEDLTRLAGAARAGRVHVASFGRVATKSPRDESPRDEGPHDSRPHLLDMQGEAPRRSWRRRRHITALALIAWATVGTAGAYVSRTYYFGPPSEQAASAWPQATPAQPPARGAPPAAAAKAGGYVVQLTAQRSKADAEASFHSLQAKFPSQLGGRTAIVRRSDLGAKGIYYRALVGPFESAGAAGEFCGSLKTAGGQCIVQRN